MCHCLVINWTVPHRFGGLLFKWWGNMLSFNRYTVKEYYRVIDKSNNINNTETNCQHSCFHCKWNKYPLVISHSHGKSAFLIGKPSISMGHLYHGKVLNNQRVYLGKCFKSFQLSWSTGYLDGICGSSSWSSEFSSSLEFIITSYH
jgi:hypothetical protein